MISIQLTNGLDVNLPQHLGRGWAKTKSLPEQPESVDESRRK